MTSLVKAFCEFCQEHFVRADVRTGDLHNDTCGHEVVVVGPWTGWAASDGCEPSLTGVPADDRSHDRAAR
jgi:hypothetical protein